MEIRSGIGKYLQAPDAIERLADDLRGAGGLYVLGGGRALDQFLPRFHPEDTRLVTEVLYQQAPCWQECVPLAEKAKAAGLQAVLGVGGGVAMDMAKAVAEQAGLPLALVPGVAATCSGATRLITLYNTEGKRTGRTWLSKPLFGVYVDETMLARSPRRTLAAGIADSLAKFSEAVSARLYDNNPSTPLWEELYAQAEHIVTQQQNYAQAALEGDMSALKRVLFANIYLTARCTELGSDRRLAEVAHAFANAVGRVWPNNAFLHGEIVGLGVLLEMRLTGPVSGITERTLRILLRDTLRCPILLQNLGVDTLPDKLHELVTDMAEHTGLSPRLLERALESLRTFQR